MVMIIRGSRFSSVVLRLARCAAGVRLVRMSLARMAPVFNSRGRGVATSGQRAAGVQFLRRARVMAVSKSVTGLLSARVEPVLKSSVKSSRSAGAGRLLPKAAPVSQSSLRSSRSAGAGRLLSKVVSESVGRLRGRLGAPSGALRGRAVVVSGASCVESSWGEDFDYFGRAAAREDRPSGGGGGVLSAFSVLGASGGASQVSAPYIFVFWSWPCWRLRWCPR